MAQCRFFTRLPSAASAQAIEQCPQAEGHAGGHGYPGSTERAVWEEGICVECQGEAYFFCMAGCEAIVCIACVPEHDKREHLD